MITAHSIGTDGTTTLLVALDEQNVARMRNGDHVLVAAERVAVPGHPALVIGTAEMLALAKAPGNLSVLALTPEQVYELRIGAHQLFTTDRGLAVLLVKSADLEALHEQLARFTGPAGTAAQEEQR